MRQAIKKDLKQQGNIIKSITIRDSKLSGKDLIKEIQRIKQRSRLSSSRGRRNLEKDRRKLRKPESKKVSRIKRRLTPTGFTIKGRKRITQPKITKPKIKEIEIKSNGQILIQKVRTKRRRITKSKRPQIKQSGGTILIKKTKQKRIATPIRRKRTQIKPPQPPTQPQKTISQPKPPKPKARTKKRIIVKSKERQLFAILPKFKQEQKLSERQVQAIGQLIKQKQLVGQKQAQRLAQNIAQVQKQAQGSILIQKIAQTTALTTIQKQGTIQITKQILRQILRPKPSPKPKPKPKPKPLPEFKRKEKKVKEILNNAQKKRQFIYLADLESVVTGTKAKSKRPFLARGRIFTGLEDRPIV